MSLSRISRLNLGHYPTPVDELPRFRDALAQDSNASRVPRILIKRDDLTGPGFGGNKVRKLEYVLAKALAERTEVVITVGGLRSNHARITAALCARLGIKCVLVLNGALEASGYRPASIALEDLYGADVRIVAAREDRDHTMRAVAEELRGSGKRVFEVPLGASIPLGALGYVAAFHELVSQLGPDIQISHVVHASSSGGTQAGLIAGCRMAGYKTTITGVSPDNPAEEIAAEVTDILNGMSELVSIPRGDNSFGVEINDEFIGPGYGIASNEGCEATSLLARTEGIVLDPVYTAKAMAALISWIKDGRYSNEETVLFWHTGGQMALFESRS